MNKYIEAIYKLYIDNDGTEKMIEQTNDGEPMRFYTGMGMTIEGFEDAIKDYAEGDDYDFTVPKEKAYGEYHPEMLIELDKSIFSPNGKFDTEHVYVDAILPLQNEDGNRFLGHVVDITDDKVKVDLNHPLAGKDLTFRGTILKSREASDDEIADFKQQLNDHHHCGGSCDNCGSGSCGSGDCGDGGCGDGGCCGNCH